MNQVIHPVHCLRGEIEVPADKSISHRAFMFSSLAHGTSYVHNPLQAEDVVRTMQVFQAMGIEITKEGSDTYRIVGKGLYGLKEPSSVIDVGNSGTTIRLLMGILAAQPFHTVLIGDSSIGRRPMARVTNPLRLMGAKIDGREDGNFIPIAIRGQKLNGIEYTSPIASAQLKSALLLAGLYAEGSTAVIEPMKSRDHTERMLRSFGIEVKVEHERIQIHPHRQLKPVELRIPGDFSSASFFIVAALMIPNSEIILRNVGINSTRIGLWSVLEQMSADIEILHQDLWGEEPVADLRVKSQPLKGVMVEGEMIPRIIDEIPILAVLATQAEGITEIRNAEELRVKESDRIKAIVTELSKFNAKIEELPDGIRIYGKTPLKGAQVSSHGDHRIAMSLLIAGLSADGQTVVENTKAIDISYPTFMEDLKKLV